MYKSIRNAVILAGTFTIIVLSLGLQTWRDRILIGGFAMIAFVILVVLIGERVRRVIQGYYTYMRGGAEDGDLVYAEGDNVLRLYFERQPHTIYVPSSIKWSDVMPDWAKEKRDLIMTRIKGDVGKHWRFEDTESKDHILTQS